MTDKKIDAYIDKPDIFIDYHVCGLKDGEYMTIDRIINAHTYNILSKEEYQKKYPIKPNLDNIIENLKEIHENLLTLLQFGYAKQLLNNINKLKQLNK
jgi:hypothetical protein